MRIAERLAELKRRVSLRDILLRDNVQLRRCGGSRYAALCPFHQERTPSFYLSVTPAGDRYKCFGCGASGDVVDYWTQTRNKSVVEAEKDLCSSEGIPLTERTFRPAPLPQEAIGPLEGGCLETWQEGLEFLKSSKANQKRIADWRGFEPTTIAAMADFGLMAMPKYRGERSEAFAVNIPSDSGSFLAGYHVHTPNLKGRYRFNPQGIGSWPFVIGNIVECHALVILEGQWDAIAFWDAIGAHKEPINGVAIVGVRGASSWRKLLDYDWSQEVQAFVFADGDEAGMQWSEPDSLSGALNLRCRALHFFTYEQGEDGVKDFNDWIKKDWGIDAAILRDFMREKYKAGLQTRRRKWQTK